METRMVLDRIRVVHYADERITDHWGRREELTWREYHAARNRLFDICAKHGTAGPMGKRDVEGDEDASDDTWHVAHDEPDFWIVDDQLNYERYLYLEICSPMKVTEKWLCDALSMGEDFAGWGVCVTNVRKGYMIILPPVILVMGPAFARAGTAEECVEVLRQKLDV